ncbi:protein PAXX isoform X2 [Myotis daubentonii]|uniref:protein PAXX isoform X2 n=1 Tax=Myotis daubentonii TaxID=98922 RepID=UPI002872BBC6|nr:protein PAXX isoform X2 [Myotis daubentonii]
MSARPPLPVPLCTLPPGPGPPRFVCYCEEEDGGAEGPGGFSLYVTDAAQLWSTGFPPGSLAALKARFGLSAAEDIAPRFRAAFQRQAVAVTLQEDGASLTLSGGAPELDFELSKVPGPEAAPRLQALTLGLAERVCSLERQLAGRRGAGRAPHSLPGLPLPVPPFLASLPSQLQRRQPSAPGRARGRGALSSSSQVRPLTRAWGGACPFLCDSVSLSAWRGGGGPGVPLHSGPSICFPQTQSLREAARDLGSGGGAPGNRSSTPASKETSQWCRF